MIEQREASCVFVWFWTLQHVPGLKACFQYMQMNSGQDQKASTVLYMERRSNLIIKYSSFHS